MFERFDTPVRCSAGHLFTTIRVPLGSLKAVRLGLTRYQYCPVGHHWASVSRLDLDEAPPTTEELANAALVHVRIPSARRADRC
jgi:hypothetical protein